MIDLQRLQEAIYKYEYLIKDKERFKDGTFAQNVFKELGINEDNNTEIKQEYCSKKTKTFHLCLFNSEITKKDLYILQILPFLSKIYYYHYNLEGIIKSFTDEQLKAAFNGYAYVFPINIRKTYKKYTRFKDFLLEFDDNLNYNNLFHEELTVEDLEEIQKNLLKEKANNSNFVILPKNNPGSDIKINNIYIELKATQKIQNMHTNTHALYFNNVVSQYKDLDNQYTGYLLAKYFVLSYIFPSKKEMISIIMKNDVSFLKDKAIVVPQKFVDIINDTSLSDSEKVEKLKEIKVMHKGIEYKFMSREEIFDFFNNLPATPN
ncbi:MAG: hypothetical protein QXL51_05745 [Candidatus Aenigmatarchaeota archaeon]